MSRDARTNVILFISVILLALLAWFEPGLQQTEIQYLSSLKANEVSSIIIERQDIGQIKLAKQGEHWYLNEPYQLPANTLRVNTIKALAEKRSYTQFFASDDDLERYQLDKPPLSVWLNETKLVLGNNDPINQQRYAMNIADNIQTNKNTIHLINGVIYYQLRANLDTFVSLKLLPPDTTIESISWSDKKLTMNDNLWQLSPEMPEVSADSIAQFIQFWQHAQASKVETNVALAINNAELVQSQNIRINLKNSDSQNSSIHYLIIQKDNEVKLLRTDLQVAYWITPQILKLLTEFIPVQE